MAADVQLPGRPVRQFTVFLENRAGSLMRLVKFLGDAGMAVLGLSVSENTDITLARVVVSDPDSAEPLFLEKGIPFAVCELVVVELADGPAGLSRCLQAIQGAEINILFAYPLLARPEGRSALALHLEDTGFGARYLQSVGFRILMQEDLTR